MFAMENGMAFRAHPNNSQRILVPFMMMSLWDAFCSTVVTRFRFYYISIINGSFKSGSRIYFKSMNFSIVFVNKLSSFFSSILFKPLSLFFSESRIVSPFVSYIVSGIFSFFFNVSKSVFFHLRKNFIFISKVISLSFLSKFFFILYSIKFVILTLVFFSVHWVYPFYRAIISKHEMFVKLI